MRQVWMAAAFVAVSISAEAQTVLGSQRLLPTSNRNLGTYISSSVDLTVDLLPVGTQWIILRTDNQPQLITDPATEIFFTWEWFDPAIQAFRTGGGGLFRGGPGHVDRDGNPLRYLYIEKHVSDMIGKRVRFVIDCRSDVRVGVVAEFYDVL